MSIKTLRARLEYAGGDAISRINKQKLRSLQAALKNDYNSRIIRLPDGREMSCLMNLNNLKPDYDKKYISIEHSAKLSPGDVYTVLDDGTHWMIYLPDLAETAYLRSEIIRCRYNLQIGDRYYWIYFQGPTETTIQKNLNHGLTYNGLNWSGTIFIENNEDTRKYFDRFKRFKIEGHTWEAKVVDYISVPGILEVEVGEYFDNSIADLPEITKRDCELLDEEEHVYSTILGSSEAKPGTVAGFHIEKHFYNKDAKWKVEGNPFVRIKEIHDNGLICSVEVDKDSFGFFDVIYDNERLRVTIDTSDSKIHGDRITYPYGIYEYTIDETDGDFVIESPLARIREQSNGWCKVEILSGKSGRFRLLFREHGSGHQFELPVQIKSL